MVERRIKEAGFPAVKNRKSLNLQRRRRSPPTMSDDSCSSSVSAVPGACRMPGATWKPSTAPLASAIALSYMYGTALACN